MFYKMVFDSSLQNISHQRFDDANRECFHFICFKCLLKSLQRNPNALPSVGLIHILLPVSVDVLRVKSLFNDLFVNIELCYSEQRLYHSRCIYHLSNQTLGSYRIHLRYKVGQRPKKLKHVNEPNYCN